MSCVVLREIDIMNEEGEAQKKQKKEKLSKVYKYYFYGNASVMNQLTTIPNRFLVDDLFV
jgi:hypothetical protein